MQVLKIVCCDSLNQMVKLTQCWHLVWSFEKSDPGEVENVNLQTDKQTYTYATTQVFRYKTDLNLLDQAREN